MSASRSSDAKGLSLPASPPSWQAELAHAITDPAELLRRLRLDGTHVAGTRAAADAFSLRVTRHFLSLMRPGDPDDPLLRQVLPLAEELSEVRGYLADPVGDKQAAQGPGVLHKYLGRILLVVTGACAIHCRYCFRRHFPYGEQAIARGGWEPALQCIARMPDVHEVILSGGDPLMLSDARLGALIRGIEALPNIRRLRVHTRLPIVLPSRLTGELERLLGGSRLGVVVVLHANHPRELSPELRLGLWRLHGVGVRLLNQAVLLRGVNDREETLIRLSERLFDWAVLPYYLHQLDRVAGAAHFAVSDRRGIALIGALRERLPGYLVPRLVVERPGAPAKVPLELSASAE